MDETITFVGLDVHKNSIAVAVVDGGLAGEVRSLGMIDNTPKALDRLIARPGRAFLLRGRPLRLRRLSPFAGAGIPVPEWSASLLTTLVRRLGEASRR
jgi:hypothetical protein